MPIVFYCQSCGARFEVEARLAGKKGRCKQCGQVMTVPRADELSSMLAMSAVPAAAVGAVPAASEGAAAAGRPVAPGTSAGGGQIKLAPITVDRMRVNWRGKDAPAVPGLDEDHKPYKVVKPSRREARERSSRPAGFVTRVWRGQLGRLQKIFRWLNQTAYLVSVPFFMLLLLGAALHEGRPMALFGAAVVVLLNAVRLGTGAVNLALVPLRDGLDWRKMKKPMQRTIEPAVTIALVLAAFAYIPWLSSGAAARGSASDRFRSSAKELGTEIEGRAGSLRDAGVDLDKLTEQAQEQLKGLAEKAQAIDFKKLSAEAR
jgi:hypothetical protein